jgi:phosphatidate cytidylyltransferase
VTDSEAPRVAPGRARRLWSDLGSRFISAIVLLALLVAGLWLGGYVFAALVGAAFAGAYREWEQVVTLKPLSVFGGVLIASIAVAALVFPPLGGFGTMAVVSVAAGAALLAGGEPALWRAGGLMFLGVVIVAALSMRGDTTDGILVSVLIGACIWGTDTGAFFTGRIIGGEKLAPDISPGKTRSGAIGGFVFATILGTVLWVIFTESPIWIGVVMAGVASILGQLGDLAESAIKRRFRVKDSGDLIPGHGGLMDRLDSITFGVIFVFLVGALHGGSAGIAGGYLHW